MSNPSHQPSAAIIFYVRDNMQNDYMQKQITVADDPEHTLRCLALLREYQHCRVLLAYIYGLHALQDPTTQ